MASPLPAPRGTPQRRKHVPGTQVLKWRHQNDINTKPAQRRPLTACKGCRSAKAKCNGQETCDRCKKKRLSCTYGPSRNKEILNVGDSTSAEPPSSSRIISASTTPLNTNEATLCPFNLLRQSDDNTPGVQLEVDPWNAETFNHALEEFDWVFPDPGLDIASNHGFSQHELHVMSNPMEEPAPLPIRSEVTTAKSTEQNSTVSLLQREQPHGPCQCSINMMMQTPKLECAITTTPKLGLDKIFKITGDVVRSCQEATQCGCRLGAVDLVRIMTVFQQTAFCFDYITKSGLDGTVNLAFGDYCVSMTDNASVKKAIVLDLVRQADQLLDTLDSRAKDLLLVLSDPEAKGIGRSPRCLNNLNLNYVQTVGASFKKLFGLITDYFSGKGPYNK